MEISYTNPREAGLFGRAGTNARRHHYFGWWTELISQRPPRRARTHRDCGCAFQNRSRENSRGMARQTSLTLSRSVPGSDTERSGGARLSVGSRVLSRHRSKGILNQ
jgi:hypothetical protein